jgi:pimeloyl-ACP methyl ester carboxylesterase
LQGELQWYRCGTDPRFARDLSVYAGRRIAVPLTFLSGAADWGTYQRPGALEAMEQGRSCADYRGTHLIPGAGHWLQQEQPGAVVERILGFLG